MVKIGWIGLRQSISHLGSQSVGRQPSMNESVRVTTNANGLGTSAMTEGQVLLLTIALVMVVTFLTNAAVWLVLP